MENPKVVRNFRQHLADKEADARRKEIAAAELLRPAVKVPEVVVAKPAAAAPVAPAVIPVAAKPAEPPPPPPEPEKPTFAFKNVDATVNPDLGHREFQVAPAVEEPAAAAPKEPEPIPSSVVEAYVPLDQNLPLSFMLTIGKINASANMARCENAFLAATVVKVEEDNNERLFLRLENEPILLPITFSFLLGGVVRKEEYKSARMLIRRHDKMPEEQAYVLALKNYEKLSSLVGYEVAVEIGALPTTDEHASVVHPLQVYQLHQQPQ